MHRKTPDDLSVDDTEELLYIDSNFFLRFLRSSFYAMVSQSEIVCYTMVIINQLVNASVISLPLPLFVFLWGCLSVPRPSKTFWITLITYTEAMVVIKYAYGFQFWPWLENNKPSPIRIVGVEENSADKGQSLFDLLLLLVLFFHRFMLKV